MNKLSTVLANNPQDLLTVYFTAGYPNLNDTQEILKELSNTKTDIIEVGMPYSDPLADGPTIQESGAKALENGMYLQLLFEQLNEVEVKQPMLMMGYFNQFIQYGPEKFCQAAEQAGVSGVIFPDMPLYVYEEQFKDLFEEYNLLVTFLITPRTSDERIKEIDALSKGFIYAVSSTATTGKVADISQEQKVYFERLKALNLKNPVQIGFGISDKKAFETACNYANGAIIGSALIKALKEDNVAQSVNDFISSIKS